MKGLKMPKMNGGEAVIRSLKAHGVNVFFGVPAGSNLAIFDALHEHPDMRAIVTRHEQGAAFMADGYARASGKTGVAVTVPGDGLMNAMTPLAQALSTSSPVLMISGNNPPALVEHVSVWSKRVERARDIHSSIAEAAQFMAAERPGPTILEIPPNVLAESDDIEIPSETETPRAKSAGDAAKIEEAAGLLAQAERPFIYLGERVARLDASDDLLRLAEILGAPYLTTRRGKGAIREDTQLHLGTGWDAPIAGSISDKLMSSVDVALCVEAPPTLGPAFQGKVISVSIDRESVSGDASSRLAIPGHPKNVLVHLRSEVEDRVAEQGGGRQTFPLDLIESFKKEAYERDREHEPLALETLKLLRSALPPEAIVMSDSLIGLWGCRWFDVLAPGTFHFPNGTLGFAMPAAIGAKLAYPERPTIAIAGDGAFMYTASDLATAVQNKVSVKIIICNSRSYGAIHFHQMRRFGRSIATELTSPDFVRFARSFGASATAIESHRDIPRALKKILWTDEVSLIDMPLTLKPM